MAEQKLTTEEINEIKSVQESQETLVNSFGELEFQIQLLELQKEKLVNQLEDYKTKEKELANKLSQKYGNGTINIEEGIFQS
jgi:predicted  nucleic acid-binding Zn-ribbon protein